MQRVARESANALAALSLAASALPGIVQSRELVDETSVSVAYSTYGEDDIKQTALFIGDQERYDIEVGQFRLLTRLDEETEVGVEYSYDDMSGASPWFLFPDGDDAIVAMSGATIKDERKDYALTVNRKAGESIIGGRLRYSEENDYESWSYGLLVERAFNNALTTLNASIQMSDDRIDATDADKYVGRPTGEDKRSWEYVLGISQVVDKFSVIRAAYTYSTASGYLSDPYKLSLVNFRLQQDRRPDHRDSDAFTVGYTRYIEPLNGALDLSYRYFSDDWSIDSQTIEVSWHQNIGCCVSIKPFFRSYSQSQADFYAPFYRGSSVPDYYSSDFRLSAYNASSWGAQLKYQLSNWSIALYGERYTSGDEGLLKEKSNADPALVDFNLFSVELGYTF